MRTGDLSGVGGSGAIGMVIRPVQALQFYGEASIDAVSAPAWLKSEGGIITWTTMFVGGIRLSFG